MIIENQNINYIPYYLKVYEADSLNLAGDNKNALQVLETLFKQYKPINTKQYKECEVYLKLLVLSNKNDENMLLALFSKYGYTYKNVEKDSILNISLQKNKIEKNHYASIRKFYLSKIDYDLREEIIKMNINDQKYRYSGFSKKTDSIDRINDKKMMSIIKSGKFPNQETIGLADIFAERNYEPVYLYALFNHLAHYENYTFYKNELLSLIKKGISNPENLAMLEDSKHARYIDLNTLIKYNQSVPDNFEEYKNSLFFYKRMDIIPYDIGNKMHILINTNRKRVGLPSIEQEFFRMKSLGVL